MQLNNFINLVLRKNSPWAINQDSIESFMSVLQSGKLESFITEQSSSDSGEFFDVFERSAYIKIRGTIFGEENCATLTGAGTSNDYLQTALELANEDPSIENIILDINSPGGEVSGTDETAKLIREIRKNKNVIAVVGDMACSAAYWIASSCSKIVISETACVGSIGVRAVIQDDSEALKMEGIKQYTYLSSQSPLKDFNPDSSESVNDLQKQLDYLATIFINSVALGRSVDPVYVSQNYGKGGIIYGLDAVRIGMADEIGSLSDVIKSLRPNNHSIQSNGGIAVENNAIDIESLRAETVQAERKRVLELSQIPVESEDEKTLVNAAIENGINASDVALKILNLRSEKNKRILESRKADAKEVPVIESVEPEPVKNKDVSALSAYINKLNAQGGVK